MGRLSPFLLALAVAAALATGLSACGDSGSDLLPGTTASEINSNLDEVQQLVSEGDCVGATDAAATVSTQVEDLTGVDKELKEALSEGATRLNEVVSGCEEAPDEAEEEQAAQEADELAAEEAAEEEATKKPKKSEEEAGKPEKEPKSQAEPPEPPGQEKKEEKEEVPPTEEEGQSGGVGPGAEVGGE
jgi:outer membrane biosynthesis protein TonB